MGSEPGQGEGSYETLRSKASHEFLALNLFLAPRTLSIVFNHTARFLREVHKYH